MRIRTENPWVQPSAEILIASGTAAQLREQVEVVERTSPNNLGDAEDKMARLTEVMPLIREDR